MIRNFFRRAPAKRFKLHLLILSGMLAVNLLSAQDPAILEKIPLHERWLFPTLIIKTDTAFSVLSENRYKTIKNHFPAENIKEQWSLAAEIKGGNGIKSHQIHDFYDHPLHTHHRGAKMDLSYNQNQISFYGQAYFQQQNQVAQRKSHSQNFLSEDLYEFRISEGDLQENRSTAEAMAAVVYRPDSIRSFTVAYTFAYLDQKYISSDLNHIFLGNFASEEPPLTDPLSKVIFIPDTETRIRDSHTATVDFTQKFRKQNANLRTSITAGYTGLSRSIDHPEYIFDVDRDRPDHMYHRSFQLESTPVKHLRPSLSYQKTSKNGPLIEIGFQPDFSWQKGTSASDSLHITTGNWVDQKEVYQKIHFFRALYSGYLNYSGIIGKLHYSAFLDFEYMNQMLKLTDPYHYNIFDRPGQSAFRIDRAGIFPSLDLTYSFNPYNHLIIGAARDIHHPSPDLMFPFLYRQNHGMYHLGNPALQPEYSKNAGISFLKILGRNKFKLTGFYHDREDAIFPIRTIKDRKWIQSVANSGKWRTAGAALLTQIEVGSFSRITLGGSIYDFSFRGEESGILDSDQRIQWNLNGKMILFPRHSFQLNMEMHLHSDAVYFQGHTKNTYLYNSAIRYQPKQLPGWRFDLTLLDIFGSIRSDFDLWAQPIFSPQKSYHQESISGSGPFLELKASYHWKGGSIGF